MTELKEYQRDISKKSLTLIGELFGYCPVQGKGTIQGNAFYFRARWDE